MQYLKRIEFFQLSKAQNVCLKNGLFGEPFQSRKWNEIVHNFRARISYFEKINFFANRFTILEIFSQFFKAWVACMKKNREPISSMKQQEKKMKISTADLACLKASTISQTDSVDEMNWFTSKLYCSISLLENSFFSQTMKWTD